MKNNIPNKNELPSVAKLIKSTILAIAIATIILITVVLPAEYGIDPIGIGEMLGLAKMGEIKVSLAEEAALETDVVENKIETAQKIKADEVVAEVKNETVGRSDNFTITLEPNQGKEIKVTMVKGESVNYSWYTNGGVANFDTHADSKKLEIKYHNYEKGKLEKSDGVLEAAFDGNHGWFWRNRTSETMTVTLEVNGNYTDVVQY